MIDDDRVNARAGELLPEELAAGSEDPKAQAEAILQDSDDRESAPDLRIDHRTSAETATTGE
jgi:hypothetical protein